MEQVQQKLSIHFSGSDCSNIFTKITNEFIYWEVSILDIQKITIVGQLNLVCIVSISKKNLNFFIDMIEQLKKQLNIAVSYKKINNDIVLNSNSNKYMLTILSHNISPQVLNAIAIIMQEYKINIEKIHQLSCSSCQPIHCIELLLNFFDKYANIEKVKKSLFSIATKFCFDFGIQKEKIYKKSKRLIVMDVDSTLIQQEVIDEIAKIHGVENEVQEITRKAMEGKIDFSESLKARIQLFKGIQEEKLQLVFQNIHLTNGVENLITVLKQNNFKIGIISGGFTYFTKHLKEILDLDFHYANELEIKNSFFTGNIIGDIINKEKKAEILEDISRIENIPLEQVVAIGDGANDIDMLSKAGLGIAFHPKLSLKNKSSAFISNCNIDCVLYMLGLAEKDWLY